MKPINLSGLFLALIMLCACKKENDGQSASARVIADSVSYTVNGKKYVSDNVEKAMTFTTQSNARITSGINYNFLIQGDKDSILFVRNFEIKADKSYMVISFVKIYNNQDTELKNENNGGYLNYPKNRIDIFSPGIYKYSTDLFRNNSIPGIAVRLVNTNGEFKSFGQWDLTKPASVTQSDQQDAKFEIISIQKRESDYLLEARFNVNVFDDNHKLQKIEDGYLRFSVLKVLPNI